MSTARLIQEFKELVRIDSVSFAEGPFQKELIQRFQGLGLTIEEDASKEKRDLERTTSLQGLKVIPQSNHSFFHRIWIRSLLVKAFNPANETVGSNLTRRRFLERMIRQELRL